MMKMETKHLTADETKSFIINILKTARKEGKDRVLKTEIVLKLATMMQIENSLIYLFSLHVDYCFDTLLEDNLIGMRSYGAYQEFCLKEE